MPDETFSCPPSIAAGSFLLAKHLNPTWTGWPSTDEIVQTAGAGRTQSYTMKDRLYAVLPALNGEPGRPASKPVEQSTAMAVLMAFRDFALLSLGIAKGERCAYSDDFRRFVVGLVAPGQAAERMTVEKLASTCAIPVGTLKDWLRVPKPARSEEASDKENAADASPSGNSTEPVEATIRSPHIHLIVTMWESWKESFTDFCTMLRTEHRVPCGNTFIGNILQGFGFRNRRRRSPVEAPWSSGTYRAFYPGAQWLGDGTPSTIRFGEEKFTFNLELFMDVASGKSMGIAVTDTEDENAVKLAYEAARDAAGAPPLVAMLDNRNSNHSPGVQDALADTLLLRSTPGRGQSKALLEGEFGRFQQAMPALEIVGDSPREMARCALRLFWMGWIWGRNGKPRTSLRGKSPDDVYANTHATEAQIQEALAWFREQERRQEKARSTREARRDKVRLELLRLGLAELGIPDPDRRHEIDLAYYSREAIVRGLAKFQAKLNQGTVPEGADYARYLGGIIRQYHIRLELEETINSILEQRIRLRDLSLRSLEREAYGIRAALPDPDLPQAFLDKALAANYAVDFRFWGRETVRAFSRLPAGEKVELYRSLARRVAASFKTDRVRRDDLIDWLAEATVQAAA